MIDRASNLEIALTALPASVLARVSWSSNWESDGPFSGALVEGDTERTGSINKRIAALKGPLVLVQSATTDELAKDHEAYCLNWLLERFRFRSTRLRPAAMLAL
ncbi:hypothetical protein AJ87_46230 [Rhizobium yanglingense]|nr:hypothetical protein AJ87_46230 [Rhizobium yanglingense]